jgi:hypothetical protein
MADKAGHQGITAPGYTAAEQNIDNTTEDISNKAQGHKANLSNPSKTQIYNEAIFTTVRQACLASVGQNDTNDL